MLTRDNCRELIRALFTYWQIREASWDDTLNNGSGGYHKTEHEAATLAANGDKTIGYLLTLLDYWSNDIESLGPWFGLKLTRDANNHLQIEECPPETGDIITINP